MASATRSQSRGKRIGELEFRKPGAHGLADLHLVVGVENC